MKYISRDFRTYKEEQRGANTFAAWGVQREHQDPSLRRFFDDFNKLPFVFASGYSCSGLWADHMPPSEVSLVKNPPVSLDHHYNCSDKRPLRFEFAFDPSHPFSKPFLERLTAANDNPYSTTMFGLTNTFAGGHHFSRALFVHLVSDSKQLKKPPRTIKQNYPDAQPFYPDEKSVITARGHDFLRLKQIAALHRVVKFFLKKFRSAKRSRRLLSSLRF